MKERRGYVVLVLISTFLSIATYIAGVYSVNGDEKKFCDLINSLVAIPAQKPTDPSADPSRERSYIIYQKFEKLDHSLGC
jgi:hypothetical protein